MYYIEDEGKIVLYNSVKKKLRAAFVCIPQYKNFEIKSTDKNIIPYKGNFYLEDDPDYLALVEQDEAERIEALSMTRSDFFDGTIKAFGADSDDLLQVILGALSNLPITDLEKKVAINNYKNALNFYRKHTLFTLLSNVPLVIGEHTLVITPTQWDRFFDETAKRNPDAYKELLPPVAG